MNKATIVKIAAKPENCTIAEVVNALEFTSDQYYNGDGESHLTDAEWDGLYRYLQLADPVNKYLIGVGAAVRGDKVNLPYIMPGLDQVQDGETEKWLKSNKLVDAMIVVMDKMDGNSGQVIYDTDGNLQSAFSRGSSTEGQDLTRHFKRMKNCPQTDVGIHLDGSFAVRVEVEMKEKVFEKLNAKGLLRSRSGNAAKNPRNYVAGQLNSSEAEQVFYDNVDVIAYEVLAPQLDTKIEELITLMEYGFGVVGYVTYQGKMMLSDDALINHLNVRHDDSSWALDGLVLVPNNRSVRDAFPPRKGSSLNPVHSKKFKVGQEDNVAITEVVAIHRKVSSDGYIVPRIEIVPVDLVGVTVTYATAFNELYLKKHSLGVGAKVKITRSGDVIPFIVEVTEPAPNGYELPDVNEFGEYEWTEPNANGEQVNLVLIDVENSDAANQQKLIKFFTNLGVEFISKKSLAKLYNAGYTTPADVINANVSAIQAIVGEANGRKGMNSLHEKLNPVEPWMLAGVTPYFGRGVGRRKLKKIYDAIGNITECSIIEMEAVEGIETITAEKIWLGTDAYCAFLSSIDGKYTFADSQSKSVGSDWEDQVVTFTGYRDKDAQAKIEAQGGRIGSSVSGKTTLVVTKDPASTSSKIMKARDLGIEVIGPDELHARLN